MILETSRLILRSFQREDIEALAEIMANRDFMRFSIGPYTHGQTQRVLQKFLSWDQAGLPSQFAVISRKREKLIGIAVFFIGIWTGQMKSRSVIGFIPTIGTADLRARPLGLSAITHSVT
jgi:RimJ/RimL family protein N-acetyltransferase